ncbi:MAG: IS200/IS605 family transposase [Bacteroidetes bacterium]|nr:IS200/IS605 family transposase [Bacteroidota bacterium]
MAGTFTQIHVHLVFAVHGRQSLIQELFREALQMYITGIVQARNHKMLAIYCMPDHTHIFLGKRPSQSESDLVRDIKSNASKWLHESEFGCRQFAWQDGYGAFSHSTSQVPQVINYILNQKEHHRKKTFQEEYIGMLKDFGIEYDERYLFKWITDQ